MYGLLMGFALGAMAFTDTGREVGNKMWSASTKTVKQVMDGVLKPQSTKQSP